MKKSTFFLLITAWCLGGNAFAQSGFITGMVTDDRGEPLAGVTLLVKGKNTVTSTDAGGLYRLSLDRGVYDLEFRYMGFETGLLAGVRVTEAEVPLDMELTPSEIGLGEVVIVAYRMETRTCTTHCPSISFKNPSEEPEGTESTVFLRTDVDENAPEEQIPGVEVPFQISFQPNPANTFVQINLESPAEQLSLFDAKGTPVHQLRDLSAGIHSIPIVEFPSGAYVLHIRSGKQVYCRSLMIVHP